MIKYLLCPGPVRSNKDNDVHFVTSNQLIELYNVKSSECITNTPEHTKGIKHDLIKLYPRSSGNYRIEEIK